MFLKFLVLLLLFFSINGVFAVEKRGQASNVVNEVKTKREISRFRKVYKGLLFRGGDIIYVGKDSFLEILLFNQKKIHIYEESLIQFKVINDTYVHIYLKQGKIEVFPGENLGEYLTFLETDSFLANNQADAGRIVLTSDNSTERIFTTKGVLYLENNENSLDNIFLQSSFVFEKLKKQKLENGKFLENVEEELTSIPPDSANPLSNYDKSKVVYSNPEDPFFLENRTFTEKREIIRLYRKQKHFYLVSQLSPSYISDDFYVGVGLYPLILYNQFELKFRFYAYFSVNDSPNLESIYNGNEWNFENTRDIIGDILSKIDTLKYQSNEKTLTLNIHQIEKLSYGYGLSMNRYNNTLFSPFERYTGVSFKLDYETLILQGFLSNASDPNLMAFRLQTFPFDTGTEEESEEKTSFGFTFIIDLGPKSNKGNPEIYMGSLDFNIPILSDQSSFDWLFFVEFAFQGFEFNNQDSANFYSEDANQLKLIDDSFGLILGATSKILDILELRFDYRYLSKGFIGEYIDTFYEIRKSEKAEYLFVDEKEDYHGFLGGLAINIENFARIYFEYYYESGSIPGYTKDNNRLHFELESHPFLDPGFVFSFQYDQRAFDTFKDLLSGFMGYNSVYSYRFKYTLNENFDFIFNWKQFFENNSGEYKNEDLISITAQYLY